VCSDVVEDQNVRVRERSRGAGFLLEPAQAVRIGGEGGGEHLHGHLAPKPRVAGAVDLSHAPGAQRGEDLVRPETCSGRDRHIGVVNLAARPRIDTAGLRT